MQNRDQDSRLTNEIPKNSWTVRVHMAGDNSLHPEGVQDLKEMKQVGSTAKVTIVAQFGAPRI